MNTKGATPHRLLALFGFGLAVAVLTSNGLAPLITATQSIGLFVVVIIAFEAIPLGLKAAGFRMFLGPRSGANRVDIVLARWIRQSVSQLLPVARVGGDIAGARVLHLRGVAAPLAGASGVGDLTLGVTGQTLLTVVGVMVWWQLTPGHAWAWPVLASAILLLGGLVGFAYVQTRGMFARLARQGRRISTRFTALAGGADALDRETKRLFQRRPRVAADLGLQFLAHLIATGEILLIAYALDTSIGIAEALVIQSVSGGLRAAAFFIPGGLGVQEGGIVALAEWFALGSGVGIAIALFKRLRELAVGLPALWIWYRLERLTSLDRASG